MRELVTSSLPEGLGVTRKERDKFSFPTKLFHFRGNPLVYT
jgi:hypothetical protein